MGRMEKMERGREVNTEGEDETINDKDALRNII